MGDTHGVSTGRLTKAVSKRIWNPVTVPVPAEHSNHFEPVTYNRVRLARGKLGGGALTTMIRAVPGGPDHPNQSPKNQEKASRLSQGLAQRYPDWGLGAGLLPSRYDALSPKKKEGVDMQIDREVRGQHKADLSGVQHQEIDSPDQSPTHEPTPIPRSKKSARDKAAKIAKTAVSIIADPQHDKIHGREVTQALSRPIKAAAGKVHRTLKALGMAERIGSDIMRRVMNEFEGGGMATLGGPIQILGEPGDFRDSPLYAKRKAEYTARASRPNVPEEKLIEAFMRASETCEALSREFPSYSPEYIHATMINEANAWLISNSGTSIAFPRSASSHRLAL
jgi:hypothetical protein